METQKKREFAYLLSQRIDCEEFHELEHRDDGPDLTDVAQKLIETYTPEWMYYYILEADEGPDSFEPVLRLIDWETIESVVEEYAEEDKPVINLNQPAEHNPFQEDSMASPRNAYHERTSEIENAIRETTYKHFHDGLLENELEELIDMLFERVEPINWEINRQKEWVNSDADVANVYLESLGAFQIALLIAEINNEDDVMAIKEDIEGNVPHTSPQKNYSGGLSLSKKKLDDILDGIRDEE